MRVRVWLKLASLLGALFLAAWTVGAQSQQQGSGQPPATDPVAEAARKAREQKKNEPKPKKVYTDDDFKRATPGQEAPAGTPAAAEGAGKEQAANKAEKKDGETKPGESEEQKWRKKFKDMHAKIAQAEQELSVLQRELDKGQVQYYTDPQKAMSEQNTRKDINDKTALINAKKKEIEQMKQQLSDMEEQLRKSGGDIGWARP